MRASAIRAASSAWAQVRAFAQRSRQLWCLPEGGHGPTWISSSEPWLGLRTCHEVCGRRRCLWAAEGAAGLPGAVLGHGTPPWLRPPACSGHCRSCRPQPLAGGGQGRPCKAAAQCPGRPAAILLALQGWPKIAAEQKFMQTAPGFVHRKSEAEGASGPLQTGERVQACSPVDELCPAAANNPPLALATPLSTHFAAGDALVYKYIPLGMSAVATALLVRPCRAGSGARVRRIGARHMCCTAALFYLCEWIASQHGCSVVLHARAAVPCPTPFPLCICLVQTHTAT